MPIKTVLMVDDNPTDVLLLRHAIHAAGTGAEFRSVSSGTQAIDYLQTHPTPDLIVLDFVLPGESGLDLLERMLKGTTSRASAVLLSGLLPAQAEADGNCNGVSCFEKPASLDRWLDLGRHLVSLPSQGNRLVALPN